MDERPHTLNPDSMKFSVPYQPEPDYLDRMNQLRGTVSKVYIPLPPQLMGSGRLWAYGDSTTFEKKLPRFVKNVVEAGFKPEIIANSPLPDWSGIEMTLAFLRKLVDAGLQHVTVAFLPLASLIARRIPELRLTASTVAFIHDMARLERWVEEAHIESLVIDRSLNTKISEIRKLKESGLSLSMVVDDFCLPSCPIQFQHYLTTSQLNKHHEVRDGPMEKAIEAHCHRMDRNQTWKLFQSDVVPANLPRYRGLISTVKISRAPGDDALERVSYYQNERVRTHWKSGYYEPPEVFDVLQKCDRICSRCGFCSDIFNEYNVPHERGPNKDPYVQMWEPNPGLVKDQSSILFCGSRNESETDNAGFAEDGETAEQAQFLNDVKECLDSLDFIGSEWSDGWVISEISLIREGVLLRFNRQSDRGEVVLQISEADESAPCFIRTRRFALTYLTLTPDGRQLTPDMDFVRRFGQHLSEQDS